jgi:G3E family GTPase
VPDIPCILVSGYLGAGKTTLINAFLQNPNGIRATVLVNDFGKINIDASLIENTDGDTISLTNGCACCSIGDSLIETASTVAKTHTKPDLIIVEASGVAKPARLSLLLLGVAGIAPVQIVTVIDGSQVRAASKDKYISALFRDQVTAAQVLSVNRNNSPEDRTFLKSYLQHIAFAGVCRQNLHEVISQPHNGVRTESLAQSVKEQDFVSKSVAIPHMVKHADLKKWLNALPCFIHRAKGYVQVSAEQYDPAIYLVNKTRRHLSMTRVETQIDRALIGQLVLIGPSYEMRKTQSHFTYNKT